MPRSVWRFVASSRGGEDGESLGVHVARSSGPTMARENYRRYGGGLLRYGLVAGVNFVDVLLLDFYFYGLSSHYEGAVHVFFQGVLQRFFHFWRAV
jgi:hypothetical protein